MQTSTHVEICHHGRPRSKQNFKQNYQHAPPPNLSVLPIKHVIIFNSPEKFGKLAFAQLVDQEKLRKFNKL